MKVEPSPSFKILRAIPEDDRAEIIAAAETCVQTHKLRDIQEQRAYIQRLHKSGHSVIEHSHVSIKLICDRGVSHQIVRHRAGTSFAQESTRYCNYSKGKFGNEITVIKPWGLKIDSPEYTEWYKSCEVAEKQYLQLISSGVKPEIARGVLPTSLKTELILSTNLREWYYILEIRTRRDVQPDTRYLCTQVLLELSGNCMYPEIFKELADERVKAFIEDSKKGNN